VVVGVGKAVGIVQCRISSSRLPAKAMLDLGGKTLLERVLLKTSRSSLLDEIWVATSTDQLDDIVENLCERLGYNVFRGDLNDVLGRFCGCAEASSASIVVRVTADNPFTEPKFIDLGVAGLLMSDCDYVAFQNIPHGSGVEVFSRDALFAAARSAKAPEEREHVTLHIRQRKNDFKIKLLESPWVTLSRPDIRVTIDTAEDYFLVKLFYDQCKEKDTLLNFIRFTDAQSFNFRANHAARELTVLKYDREI